jgi:hypothetical protein
VADRAAAAVVNSVAELVTAAAMPRGRGLHRPRGRMLRCLGRLLLLLCLGICRRDAAW